MKLIMQINVDIFAQEWSFVFYKDLLSGGPINLIQLAVFSDSFLSAIILRTNCNKVGVELSI